MFSRSSTLSVYEYLTAQLKTRPTVQVPGLIRLGPVAKATGLLKACQADLITGGTQPCYAPVDDVIIMPGLAFYCVRRSFIGGTRYAADLLHELVHWSGHHSRLARPRHHEQFDATYNREELIAELGAPLLMVDLALSKRPVLPHAKYLSGYLATLSNPGLELDIALARANQASGFLLAIARDRLATSNLAYA